MIGYIEGEVKATRPTHCIVLTNPSGQGGLGYKIFSTKDSLLRLSPGARVSFWVHHTVREDAQDLYGFPDEAELRFFELLLTVSGIGPKSALAVLDTVSIETLQSAISQNRAEYLTKVSGIGKKTAEKIVLELKDKVGVGVEGTLKGDEEALEALRALGYTSQEARDTLRKVPSDFSNSNDRLREALKLLGTRA